MTYLFEIIIPLKLTIKVYINYINDIDCIGVFSKSRRRRPYALLTYIVQTKERIVCTSPLVLNTLSTTVVGV